MSALAMCSALFVGSFFLLEPKAAGELARRPFLGTVLEDAAPAPRQTDAPRGARITRVLDASPAKLAGLEAGDVITAVDEAPIADAAALVRAIRASAQEQAVKLHVQRGDASRTLRLPIRPAPLERSEEFDVVYGAVPFGEARLRSIVTYPRSNGKAPALLILQGLSCASVDTPTGPAEAYRWIAHAMTQRGIVTMRIDKPGVGDSEGEPCAECDFRTETAAFRAALEALKKDERVDAERVFLFGHSMGGVIAPLVASESPVRGIVVYGTAARPWFEYCVENLRRQLALSGESAARIDQAVRLEARLLDDWLIDGQELSAVLAKHADLAEHARGSSPDGVHVFGRHQRFFQQLNALNLGEAWARVDADVLALWGESDFVTAALDHRMIAEIVERRGAGRGEYRALPEIDHSFRLAASAVDALRGADDAPFNEKLIEAVCAWLLPRAKVLMLCD